MNIESRLTASQEALDSGRVCFKESFYFTGAE